MKGLTRFQTFDLMGLAAKMRLAYIKAEAWNEYNDSGEIVATPGSKVKLFVQEDGNDYGREGVTNFGETLTVKVRGMAPEAFAELKPMQAELVIAGVERATLYGEYRDQVSAIVTLKAKGGK